MNTVKTGKAKAERQKAFKNAVQLIYESNLHGAKLSLRITKKKREIPFILYSSPRRYH
jgi:hypothetical protein